MISTTNDEIVFNETFFIESKYIWYALCLPDGTVYGMERFIRYDETNLLNENKVFSK